jgi:hypothetical protein
MQARQGDILVELIPALPEKLTREKAKDGRLIVAEGELTGHHHSVAARNGQLYRDVAGILYLLILKKALMKHQEHGPIELPPGAYRVTRQREYSPQEIRHVQD